MPVRVDAFGECLGVEQHLLGDVDPVGLRAGPVLIQSGPAPAAAAA
ncbi:hypothetical protein AB0J35_51250 [Nonomuraea angiospora]